jgi:hypothetical protein
MRGWLLVLAFVNLALADAIAGQCATTRPASSVRPSAPDNKDWITKG